MRVRQRVSVGALGLALMGCGVQPTGVIGTGESASGPTRGVRMYYASASGLRGVPTRHQEFDSLSGVMKLFFQGPSADQRRDGLTNLLELPGFQVSGTGTRVTVRLEDSYAGTGRDQGTGQLVCTLARAQSVLDPKVRTDDVEVTVRQPDSADLGPYRCAEFLDG
ncbi:GerMN domain-containing protein [Streptomyces uncialis]|uniref:GerMN domain-containing protein n=1 Tax=Streptomyces uncialis TaxID=1048205 RepID=A0A1Q4VAK8_9ACTN|nr:GerMN domain-containing protein [Streptomyces uncialis]MCX4658693.1 GerMN domain-containing protein [Streptomyces uncialis]OKH94888.1 hypothetical protein AB852_12120 [Streptomyces uncialis]